MGDEKVVTINERIPSLKEQRKQRANRRLIFFLSFFFILLVMVIYFQSPFSQIQEIQVRGNHFVADERVIEASQIDKGTSIWNLQKEQFAENILNLDEIASVEIERSLPTTIIIHVEEHSRVAYLFQDSKYFPILETGQFLAELPRHHVPADAPILMNWEQGAPVAELAAELTKLSDRMIQRISEIYHTPTDFDPLMITLYMNDGFEVQSTIRDFAENIAPYPTIVRELDPTVKGVLHLKMTPYFEALEENDSEGDVDVEGEQ
ncbi:cell division protein FtsQ/DivIB [Halalkalibacterium ligniniphilum]|uniref:cell division protein FtsQ/DivIB n=1 Tax=Halalkalibacterium ligniniphilum TaxID=1134413 RepID=UPI0003497467|nr:FtsQ-type POTRA domain-containing protein [Halalkalibacterium ligniniphilum]